MLDDRLEEGHIDFAWCADLSNWRPSFTKSSFRARASMRKSREKSHVSVRDKACNSSTPVPKYDVLMSLRDSAPIRWVDKCVFVAA